MTKFDINRASPEARDELLRAFIAHEANTCTEADVDRFMAARKKWMDECEVELRTRAEVDALIVQTARESLSGGPYSSTVVCSQLVRLCAEPVTDDGSEQAGVRAMECSHCDASIDGEEASAAAICHDCWRSEDTAHTQHIADINQLSNELTEARAKIAELEREAGELADWVSPIARDLGWAGSVATIRRTVEDDRARIAELERTAEHLNELRLDAANRAHVAVDRAEAAEAKVKELERNQVTPAMLAEFESGKQQRDTLRADNERFARQLLEARNRVAELEHEAVDLRADIAHLSSRLRYVNPCEGRHLTEAEEAAYARITSIVADYLPQSREDRAGALDEIAKVLSDAERRQRTTDPHLRPAGKAVKELEHEGLPDPPNCTTLGKAHTKSAIMPGDCAECGASMDPEPERCSCEEAEELRRQIRYVIQNLPYKAPEMVASWVTHVLTEALS